MAYAVEFKKEKLTKIDVSWDHIYQIKTDQTYADYLLSKLYYQYYTINDLLRPICYHEYEIKDNLAKCKICFDSFKIISERSKIER